MSFCTTYAFIVWMNALSDWIQWALQSARICLKVCMLRRLFQESAALMACALCLPRWLTPYSTGEWAGAKIHILEEKNTHSHARSHTHIFTCTSCCNSHTGVKTTYTFHIGCCRWAFHTLIAHCRIKRSPSMQSCVREYIYLRVCNCAYMTGSHQPTYWKEGGRESPMPPVLSRGGGSSGWLSVHWDPPSEWALSARTSWGRENSMWQTVDMFVFEGSTKKIFC